MKVFDSSILKQIKELEAKQLRALSDLYINPDDLQAREHFDRRRIAIAELRMQLSTSREAPDE